MPGLKVRNIAFTLKTPLTSDVTHGSILGPVLLNNFNNDIMELVSGQGTMFSNLKRVDFNQGRKKHFTITVVRHGNILLRVIVAIPYLEVSNPGWMGLEHPGVVEGEVE